MALLSSTRLITHCILNLKNTFSPLYSALTLLIYSYSFAPFSSWCLDIHSGDTRQIQRNHQLCRGTGRGRHPPPPHLLISLTHPYVCFANSFDLCTSLCTLYLSSSLQMKSLLDPNSSIDIEDLGLNKVPKKGRPRTRELKEPKPPRIKEPKEQKAKSSHTKAQLQKASQKLLSAASSCSSSTTSEKRHASESRVRDDKTLSSIILDIPSLGINSPLRTGTPVPEYTQDESNFENMASLSGLRSFAAYTSAAPAQHILACHGEQGQGVKSGSFSSQSDSGSGEMTSATSMHDLHGLGRSPNSTCTGTGTCTPASEPGNDGTLGGLIQTNHSIDSLQIIDDVSGIALPHLLSSPLPPYHLYHLFSHELLIIIINLVRKFSSQIKILSEC